MPFDDWLAGARADPVVALVSRKQAIRLEVIRTRCSAGGYISAVGGVP